MLLTMKHVLAFNCTSHYFSSTLSVLLIHYSINSIVGMGPLNNAMEPKAKLFTKSGKVQVVFSSNQNQMMI